MIVSGPSGSPENADVLPSRRALRAQREAAEAAAEHAESGMAAVAPVEAAPLNSLPADSVPVESLPVDSESREPATAVLPVISAGSDAPTGSDASARPESAAQPAPSGERARRKRTALIPTLIPTLNVALASTLRTVQTAPRAALSPRTQNSAPKAPVRRRTGSRSPLTVLVAIVAIPGLFLTAGLPAYAFAPQADSSGTISAHAQAQAEAQEMIVADAAAHTVVSRDGFSATSVEEVAERSAELRREGAAAAARASAAKFATSGIRAEGDDYPWPFETTDNEGGGLSPLGYYYRECVDFVAWRLNRDAGTGSSPWKWTWSKMTPGNGNASGWADAWASKGWTTSTTPVVGSVAWFTYNHVAYVQSVPGDGTVVLEEYNWMGMHSYHTRTVSIDEVPLYLYPPS